MRWPYFILEAASTELARSRREHLRIVRENVRLNTELRQVKDSLKETSLKWQQAAKERDEANRA